MHNINPSINDVADWAERHLESQRGLEVGMTFGALLRVYGQLSKLPARPEGQPPTGDELELLVKSEILLASLSKHLDKTNYRCGGRAEMKIAHPTTMRTNMTYDPGPQKRGRDDGSR